MPWIWTREIAKALGISPEKAGWLMKRLGLKRRRVKGRSQWLIELELLPDELKQKLLPLIESATHNLPLNGSQNSATHESRGGSNPAIHKLLLKRPITHQVAKSQTATHRGNCYLEETAAFKANDPPRELLRIVHDYFKHNHPVIEKERVKDVLQDSLRKLLDELMPRGYKPIEIEKAVVRVIKSYRDLGFMDLLGIGDEP